ncbi:MAG: hypothetical protein IIC64_18375 [SAR324 cluster bacterium]|nr:hypothetical protein [SAR324 cluster bacterium]
MMFYLGKDHELFQRWRDLNIRTGDLWRIRGVIAHPHLYVPIDRDDRRNTGPTLIGNKPYATKPKPPSEHIGIAGLKEHGHNVWKLGQDLYKFRGETMRLLPSLQKSSRPKSPPSNQQQNPNLQIDEIPQVVLNLLEPYRLKVPTESNDE